MQETVQIKTNHFVFDCRTEGNKQNELVVLLHGFPETSYMWRRLMSHISENGFFCVAPNLRGYSKGACPKGKKHYHVGRLVEDVINISQHYGNSKFHLIGHDWGAAIGWKLVHDFQESILSWTGISVPHLQAFGKALVLDSEQRKMSQYIKDFQLPFLPEMKIRKNDFRLFKKLWRNSSAYEIDDYLQVFRNPKQLTASLNYYRCNYKHLKKAANENILGNINVPTLFIWGKKDMAIGAYSVKESHQYMKNDYEFLELDSGHWLIQTNYPELEKAIMAHILKNKSSY